MKLAALGAGTAAVVALPIHLLLLGFAVEVVLVHAVLPPPMRRGLLRFGIVTVTIAAFFYAAFGPNPGQVTLGPLRLSGADFLVGFLAGLRLFALLALFALGSRWLPARDLLPFVARGGLAGYLAGALLRSVPTIRADAERLREAQVARGHRFVAGPWGARTWLPFVVPLFVAVLRRARDQAVALHLAGLLPEGRTAHPGRRAHRWALVAALAALAIAGRLALVAWPGVSLSFFVVFIAGVAFGPLVGCLVGLLERVSTDLLLSGLHPVFLVMAPVEALLGLLAGVAGRFVNFGQRGREPLPYAMALAAWAGAAMTLVFSLAADTTSWWVAKAFLPGLTAETLQVTWLVLVLKGLAFNVPSLIFNAALFATAAYPTLRGLRQSGLLPARGPTPA